MTGSVSSIFILIDAGQLEEPEASWRIGQVDVCLITHGSREVKQFKCYSQNDRFQGWKYDACAAM